MSDVRLQRLRTRLGLSQQQARFVLRLYEAGGDAVAHRDMDDVITVAERKSGVEYVCTLACHVRRRIGKEAIQNDFCAYSLTDSGMDKVSSALQVSAKSGP